MKVKNLSILSFLCGISLLVAGCAGYSLLKREVRPQAQIEVYSVENMPSLGRTEAGQEFWLGGLSSLNVIKSDGDNIILGAITDRGPNAEKFDKLAKIGSNARPFLLPQFSPRYVNMTLKKSDRKLTYVSHTEFRLSKDKKIPGIPPSKGMISSEDGIKLRYEIPVDVYGKKLASDSFGMDSEGLCLFNYKGKTNYFVVEEYGPDLIQFDSDLVQTNRWSPGQGLPEVLSKRKINRGFEGLACDDKYIYMVMQSPIQSDDGRDKNNIRLIQFDPILKKVIHQYFYPVDPKIADKIGDIALISRDRLLVIEQNGKLGSKHGVRNIYEVNLAQANSSGGLSKKLLINLNDLGFDYVEKIEGLAVLDAKTLALVIDNDFGISGHLDLKTQRVPMKKDQSSYLALVTLDESLY